MKPPCPCSAHASLPLSQPSLQSLPRELQKDVQVLRLWGSTNPMPLGRPHASLGHI
jgi:hypothetical protein